MPMTSYNELCSFRKANYHNLCSRNPTLSFVSVILIDTKKIQDMLLQLTIKHLFMTSQLIYIVAIRLENFNEQILNDIFNLDRYLFLEKTYNVWIAANEETFDFHAHMQCLICSIIIIDWHLLDVPTCTRHLCHFY